MLMWRQLTAAGSGRYVGARAGSPVTDRGTPPRSEDVTPRAGVTFFGVRPLGEATSGPRNTQKTQKRCCRSDLSAYSASSAVRLRLRRRAGASLMLVGTAAAHAVGGAGHPHDLDARTPRQGALAVAPGQP